MPWRFDPAPLSAGCVLFIWNGLVDTKKAMSQANRIHRGHFQRVRLEVVDSRASREVVGLLVKMELKDVMVRFTNGCEE